MKRKLLFLAYSIVSVLVILFSLSSNNVELNANTSIREVEVTLEKEECFSCSPVYDDIIGDVDLTDFTGGCGGTTAGFSMAAAIGEAFPGVAISPQMKSFGSQGSFRYRYGSASNYVEAGQWHHIVEQNTVSKGINSAESVYNNYNTVAIPASVHHEITAKYNSLTKGGTTFRVYINSLSYEQQYIEGLNLLKEICEEMGIVPYWVE